MTEISAYQHGIYPRSESLVAATRDLARGGCPAATVEDQRRRDRDALIDLQRRASLDYVSSGLLSWQDLFRPLIEACPGLEAGPLARWFDNNTFYRVPVVRGPAELDRQRFARAAGLGGPELAWVGVLPGPYTFSRAAATHDGGRDRLMEHLARGVLRPAAEELVAGGARLVHFQEPWLASDGIGAGIWEPLAEVFGYLREGLGARVVVHTYFGDIGPWVARLRALPVDAVGVDLVHTDLTALAGVWAAGILVGCLDGRSSRVEDTGAVVGLARKVVEIARPPLLLLSSTCDLELVPRAIADRKVSVLGEACQRLREEIRC